MEYKVISGVEHYLNSVNAIKKNQHARLLDERSYKNIKKTILQKGLSDEKNTDNK